MRPTRLEVEGFASFRDRTTLAFDDSDLFVLTGPTGAGKSSLVDALCFALYGSVPRYDDRRAVAPAVSQGKLEARVRLDFEVAGTDYSAVRVVRRRPDGGATTREAVLECGDRELARGAAELTDAVTGLLGLPFEHFVRCVVLPQGDFAQFLHATPRERQELLVRLLDLGLYRDIARAANRRASAHDRRASVLRERLAADFADATEERLRTARRRVDELDQLLVHVDGRTGELENHRRRADEQRQAGQAAGRRAEMLEKLTVPDGVEELAGRLVGAADAVEQAEQRRRDADEALEAAHEARAAHGDPDALQELRRAYRDLADLGEQVAANRQAVRVADDRVARAEEAHGQARAAAEQIRARRDGMLRTHHAVALARQLSAGDDCPVCGRALESDPRVEPPAGLTDAEAAVARATEQVAATEQELVRARELRTDRQARLNQLEERVGQLRGVVDKAPDVADVDDKLATIAAADRRIESTRRAARAARRRHGQAETDAAALRQLEQDAWSAFGRTRDRLTALELHPPAPKQEDLAAAWKELIGWAGQRALHLREHQRQAVAAATEADRKAHALVEELRGRCRQAGVRIGDQDLRAACDTARELARHDHDRLAAAVEQAGRLHEELAAVKQAHEVASELGTHLRSDRFESWLLNRALRRLVVGASVILEDLSSGAYALSLDDRNQFEIIDHHNADEPRPAKTLSGGETFLASLALALALADHLQEFAVRGAARLEALFLDEGFGTLDPDTLDVVTSAIVELGSRGRMVGLITHVRDLADQIPVRYEVHKTATSSVVEKVVL